MELEVKRNLNKRKFQTMSGFFSFLLGLIALAGLNATLLLKTEDFPEFFLIQLPLIGLIIGVIGLFTKRHSRMYTWWGIGLNIFILFFTVLMFILAYSINAKP